MRAHQRAENDQTVGRRGQTQETRCEPAGALSIDFTG
jgi:hypothetical protein